MKAREFEDKFDKGEDISQYMDVSQARRPKQEQKKGKCGFPFMDD